MLTPDEKLRYSRNILLAEMGEEGQRRLLGSKVLIVGAGALGSVVAMYLAGSGVGEIRLVDFDTIDISNLQRQLSFTTSQCGRLKADALAERLREINPDITVTSSNLLLRPDNIDGLSAGVDLIIEGSDNPPTKYLATDEAVRLGIPYVLGGVAQWQGQVTSWRPGCRVAYRDLFPEGATPDGYTPCSIGGVLGPLPGIIGSMMATDAIKILASIGTPLYDRLLLLDTLTLTPRLLTL